MNEKKRACRNCPLTDKSEGACRKRGCKELDLPPPEPLPEPISKWHFFEGDTIGDDFIQLEVTYLNMDTGDFRAQIVDLKDKEKEPGHLGSYVTESQYYGFKLIRESEEMIIWEIPEEATDRFHLTGSGPSQFLVNWFKDSGFGIDLDS